MNMHVYRKYLFVFSPTWNVGRIENRWAKGELDGGRKHSQGRDQIYTGSICYPFVFVSILLFGIIIISMNSQKLLKHYAIGPNIDQSVKLLFTQEGYLQTYSGAM